MRSFFKSLGIYRYDETVRWNYRLNLWLFFLAYFRLSKKAICDMSQGGQDFHDWPDGIAQEPWPFFKHICRRCGKEFTI